MYQVCRYLHKSYLRNLHFLTSIGLIQYVVGRFQASLHTQFTHTHWRPSDTKCAASSIVYFRRSSEVIGGIPPLPRYWGLFHLLTIKQSKHRDENRQSITVAVFFFCIANKTWLLYPARNGPPGLETGGDWSVLKCSTFFEIISGSLVMDRDTSMLIRCEGWSGIRDDG